jgi:hypothetical protein
MVEFLQNRWSLYFKTTDDINVVSPLGCGGAVVRAAGIGLVERRK